MNKPKPQLPVGHVLIPAIAIGALSLVLAIGLSALGILTRLNVLAARLVPPVDGGSFPKRLPEWAVWLAAVVFAMALPLAILGVATAWRRVVLWITALVLVTGWAPVLSVAAHAPAVACPFVVTLWSGICALVYAANHRMESDREPKLPASPPTEPPHEAR